jgi:hypothetical protein
MHATSRRDLHEWGMHHQRLRYYYFHGIGAYAFGALYQTDGTANRFHSPNQVQVEFLCDVSDQPQPWLARPRAPGCSRRRRPTLRPAFHQRTRVHLRQPPALVMWLEGG